MKKVLIIEDLPDQSFLIQQILKRLPLQQVHCHNAESGLIYYRGGDISVIITDIGLPGMDGVEFIKMIRENDKLTPIIVVTAQVMDYDKEVSLQAGANYYLEKPIMPGELENIVALLI